MRQFEVDENTVEATIKLTPPANSMASTPSIATFDVVPIFGTDNQDVMYVRVRTEYNETKDEAIDRAIRIATKLNSREVR